MFWHIARDDTMFTSMRCISRHEDTQVYGTILPKELTNQAMLESNAYKTYYAFASGEKDPKPKLKSKAKVAKPDKKKQPAKKTKAKGLAVLSEVALTEVEQLKLATKRSKKDFHISHASGSGDGVDTYEDEDNENDSDDLSDEGDNDNDGNDGDDDDDKQEGDNTNEDDEMTDSDRTESDKIKIPIFDQSTTEYYEEEEEKIDDEETMDEKEDDEVTKELYDDVNVNLGNEDTDMTNKNGGPTQSSSVSSNFTSKLLNLDNPSPADNEIASLMDTTAQHVTTIPEITSRFTITVPSPPPFFNPLSQQTTPTPTPTTSETTTSLPALLDFASVFKINERVFNLEKDVQEAQDEKNAYIELIDTSMRALIMEEDNTQLPQILP
ncbi:hypothetical protein Tco_0337136 [Tanacetum coccineum]